MNITDLLATIRQWHMDDRRSTLKRTFELGDMIISAVIHTKMTEYQIINRIMADLGDLAMGMTSYNRAARIARVFTQNQRAVLIDKAVSLERVEVLAGAKYEGRARIKLIADIKSGKVTAPWSSITGIRASKMRPHLVHAERTDADSTANPDNVVVAIAHKGQINEDAVVNVMKNLISRLGRDMAAKLWEQAVREMGVRMAI